MELQVGKWGNSLALRLPAQVVRKLRLHEGARIELQIQSSGAPCAIATATDWLRRR